MDTRKKYLLLIVDDESFVRQGLSQYVDWNALGFSIAGTADSKGNALHFLEENPVDVILTDIRMPDGTGLELLEECKNILPDVKSVILSGYGEFEYAQKALRLGSFDFLTKPVDFSQLTDIFLRLYGTLQTLASQNQELAEIRRIKKDNFFHNVTKYSVSPDTLKLRCQEYGLPAGKKYGIFRIRSLGAGEVYTEFTVVLKEALNRAFAEASLDPACFYCFPQELHEVTVALHSISLEDIKVLSLRLEPLLASMDCIMGISSLHPGIGGLKEAYQEAGQALEYHVLQTCGRIIEYEIAESLIDFGAAYSQSIKEELLDCLSSGRSDLLSEFLLRRIDSRINDGSSIDTIKALTINSILVTQEYLKQNTSHSRPDSEIQEMICQIISLKSRHRVRDVAGAYLESIAGYVDSSRSRSPAIDRAIAYIKEHYSENITLQSLAGDIFLHPVYLSKLFKEKSGQTFLDYLTHYRIERAKEYLQNPNLRIYDIGQMVGYETPQYFSKIFKEITGCSPKGYRERLGMH